MVLTRVVRLGLAFALALLAESVYAQAEAAPAVQRSGTPETMKLSISLGGDGIRSPVVGLDFNRTRVFKETDEYSADRSVFEQDSRGAVHESVLRTRVQEVRVARRIGKKKNEVLYLAVNVATEARSQKFNLRLTLTGSGTEVWSWQDEVKLGVSKGAVAAVGVLALASPEKARTLEFEVPLRTETKAALMTNAILEVELDLAEE